MIWFFKRTSWRNYQPSRRRNDLPEKQRWIILLNDADFAKWSNDDHYKYAIKPIVKIIYGLYEAMKYSGLINEDSIKSYKLVDLPRFGEYKVISGNKNNQNQGESQIFAQYHLSGTKVGLQFAWLVTRIHAVK